MRKLVIAALLNCGLLNLFAQSNDAPRPIPAKNLPVPMDVSPDMQKIIAAPLPPTWNVLWTTGEEWRTTANQQAVAAIAALPAIRERLHVTMTASTMNGVRIYTIKPDVIPPEHKDKILIQVHGGCYVLSPGEAGTKEAIMMAGFGHYEVIAVDYRMPPEAYFPAALDDAMTF
jgi:acetyl esterase/lipase